MVITEFVYWIRFSHSFEKNKTGGEKIEKQKRTSKPLVPYILNNIHQNQPHMHVTNTQYYKITLNKFFTFFSPLFKRVTL